MSFVGLHIHSNYSLLDGASQLPQLIDRALELDMPAIALTDHGVMYGAIELAQSVQRGWRQAHHRQRDVHHQWGHHQAATTSPVSPGGVSQKHPGL
jgi:histidinol phosphatase-like PHP family hydrolase